MKKILSSSARKGVFLAKAQDRNLAANDAQVFDNSLTNAKKPDNELDKKQRVATTGETVPIIFGKRANNIGGIWLQPPILKAGTSNFVQKLLFVISQGEIASTPSKATAYAGLKKLIFLNDTSVTLTHVYNSVATINSSPSTCPISGTGLYCGNNIYSYLNELVKASTGTYIEKSPDLGNDYYGSRVKTFGSGDTTNITFTVTQAVFDAETGADITSAYSTFTGFPVNTEYVFNGVYSALSGNLTGGKAVGTIEDSFDTGNTLFPPLSGSSLTNLQQVSGGRTKFIFKYTFVSVQNPANASNPASTGTLEGIQQEVIIGTSSTIQDASNNNSSFADITFLATSANLFDAPTSGSFPTSTKQLYIFYEEGVKVNKFSAGLSGSNYPVGASNQFIDLALHLFELYKKLDGNNTTPIVSPVDTSNLVSIAAFCSNNSMFYNGIIDKSINIIEFITKISPFFFLSFLSVGGQYKFSPLLPVNNSNQINTSTITPVMTFNESNIINKTFNKTYISIEDRRDFIVNCIYLKCIPTEIGSKKTTSIRFTSTTLDAPVEQFDLTDFCSDVNHAILYAKYELSKRKHSTHNISFSTSLITTSLIPTDIIKLQRQRQTSVGDNRTEIEYYQVTSITYDNDGVSNIMASHFPLNNSNVSEIINEINNGTYTILQ